MMSSRVSASSDDGSIPSTSTVLCLYCRQEIRKTKDGWHAVEPFRNAEGAWPGIWVVNCHPRLVQMDRASVHEPDYLGTLVQNQGGEDG